MLVGCDIFHPLEIKELPLVHSYLYTLNYSIINEEVWTRLNEMQKLCVVAEAPSSLR